MTFASTLSRRMVLLSGVSLAACGAAAPEPLAPTGEPPPLPGDDAVFIGPLPTWLDVKVRFGAVGDGQADDTAALQRALDALDVEGAHTLYFPPGVYRITRTLELARSNGRRSTGLSVQGAHPDSVTLRWDGAPQGAMLKFDAWYSKLGRITFDGAGKARTGLRQGPFFVTANELADLVFTGCDYGIETGLENTAGIAETSVQRCRFIGCAKAGALLQNFNSLDWWFWHCRFEDCGVGVTNAPGAGNFYVYESLFRNSRVADIRIRNTGYFSFRDNVSINSRAFFEAEFIEAAAQISFQRNRIIDWTGEAAISVGNWGPVILADNLFVGRTGKTALAADRARRVELGGEDTAVLRRPGRPAVNDGGLRVIDRARANLALPALPRTPPQSRMPVFAARPGASSEEVQALIDRAAAAAPAVVHLPAGDYKLQKSLVLPPGRQVWLVGDGVPNRTQLSRGGPDLAPLIIARAPSQARLRDIALVGEAQIDGLVVEGPSPSGSKLWLLQTLVSGSADTAFDLAQDGQTLVLMRDINHADSGMGVRVSGPNGGGGAVILSGSSSNNKLSYEVKGGARFLARDIWYEASAPPGFAQFADAGDFTLWGSNIALPVNPPAVAVNATASFHGQATFLGVEFQNVGGKGGPIVRASGPTTTLALLGCNGTDDYLAPGEAGARAVRVESTRVTANGGAAPTPDIGVADAAFVRRVTELARRPLPPAHPVQPAGNQGDLRLYRVQISSARKGISLRPAG